MPEIKFGFSVGGSSIAEKIAGRLIDMTVTDGTGSQSDTVQITLDDPGIEIATPTTGQKITPYGGTEERFRDFGEFTVDTVDFEGYPTIVIVNAQSVAAKGAAKQREAKGFPKKKFPTYGDVFKEVAGKIGYPLMMASELKSKGNPGEYQSEENGLEFLSRIAEKIGAGVTVKSNRLVVVKKGAGESAGGSLMATLNVAPGINLLTFRVSLKDKPRYASVEASYYDRDQNERVPVKSSTGLDGPKYALRASYKDEDEAQAAADAKAKDLVRAKATATFTIEGDAFAMAEAYVNVSGCRPDVDGLWRVKTATHNFSSTAPYTTDLECEAPSS